MTRKILLAGTGAIGARFAAGLAAGGIELAWVCDGQRVAIENVRVGGFVVDEIGAWKAEVVAERLRRAGVPARALVGEIRDVVRPGLVRAADVVVGALDNAAAIEDLSDVVWSADRLGLPLMLLTCGGDNFPGYLVRIFAPPLGCPRCRFGRQDVEAVAAATQTASCAASSAPRASAAAAEAAAEAGLRVLGRLLAGEDLTGLRLQREGDSKEFTAGMSPEIAASCPVPHGARPHLASLGGGVGAVTVGTLAGRARALAGADAVLLLGRRGVPAMGLCCPGCHRVWTSPLALLPAAVAHARPCECRGTVQPLGLRSTITAAELAASDVASWTLAEFGAGPGDEFLVTGEIDTLRLGCELDGGVA